jgi:hypothetical protein
MPVAPTTWLTGPITAKQLITDLYDYSPGNYHAPNGINYHANRPLYVAGLNIPSNTQVSSAGTFTNVSVTNGAWRNFMDTGGLWGNGADLPGNLALGQFLPIVPGSYGFEAQNPGGLYLLIGFVGWGSQTSAGGCGAGLGAGASGGEPTPGLAGAKQLASTTRDNCSYVIDLIAGGPNTYNCLQGYAADSSGTGGYTYLHNGNDYSGETTRFYSMWCGVASLPTPATSLPTPQATYGPSTAITAAFLNGNSGIAGPLAFLNNPPMLRLANLDGATVATNTVFKPALSGNPQGISPFDNFGAYVSGTNTYTVPISGVYLVHATVNYAANTGGQRQAGVQVNGSLNLWGGSYQAAGVGGTAPQMTRLLDLQVGDTLQLITQQNTGASTTLANGQPARLIAIWLGALSPSGSQVVWNPPDTSFRWQAGTQSDQLPLQFFLHMANDLGFLINRPYMMAYQTTQQSSSTWGTWNIVTMNTLGGRVHGSGSNSGDNYNGWVSGASNSYQAVVAGWYLVVAGYNQTAPAATTHLVAGIRQSPGGNNVPDWYQHLRTASSTFAPGVDACGFYYLRPGDSVQPQFQPQDGSGTWTTFVGAGQESHFGVVWISE